MAPYTVVAVFKKEGAFGYYDSDSSVVDLKLFFSDPDPTFQEISDPDPASDPISNPTKFISKEAIFFMLTHFGSARPYF